MEIEIDFRQIVDWASFHSIFAVTMGFPNFYGTNMNAWIDCMSYIDDPGAGMSTVTVSKGEPLDLVLITEKKTTSIQSEILVALIECIGSVNQRFIEDGSATRIRLTAT